jgi:hypothetical protein
MRSAAARRLPGPAPPSKIPAPGIPPAAVGIREGDPVPQPLRAAAALVVLLLAACGGGSSSPSGPVSPNTSGWWRDQVFYEVFVRSFADSNGDGVGDLAGLTAR